MSDHLQPETLALHTGIHRSQFNEHSEAMYQRQLNLNQVVC